jgi:hypothetical protein
VGFNSMAMTSSGIAACLIGNAGPRRFLLNPNLEDIKKCSWEPKM